MSHVLFHMVLPSLFKFGPSQTCCIFLVCKRCAASTRIVTNSLNYEVVLFSFLGFSQIVAKLFTKGVVTIPTACGHLSTILEIILSAPLGPQHMRI